MRISIELPQAVVDEVNEHKKFKKFATFEGALNSLIENGASRTSQLRNYAIKQKALRQGEHVEFRPYAPLTASATTRKKVKQEVKALNEFDTED